MVSTDSLQKQLCYSVPEIGLTRETTKILCEENLERMEKEGLMLIRCERPVQPLLEHLGVSDPVLFTSRDQTRYVPKNFSYLPLLTSISSIYPRKFHHLIPRLQKVTVLEGKYMVT